MATDKLAVPRARKYVEGTIDGKRNDGQLQLVGKGEGTSAEGSHVAIEGACPFRKDHHADAILQGFFCFAIGVANSCPTALIYKDIASVSASHAEEGNLLEFLLEHPAYLGSEIAADEEDVVGSLVVGYKDIFLVLVYILPALDGDGEEGGLDDEASPPA